MTLATSKKQSIGRFLLTDLPIRISSNDLLDDSISSSNEEKCSEWNEGCMEPESHLLARAAFSEMHMVVQPEPSWKSDGDRCKAERSRQREQIVELDRGSAKLSKYE